MRDPSPADQNSVKRRRRSGTLIVEMRLLLYNIRYGLGLGAAVHWPLPGAGFLLGNRGNLQRITDFIKAQDPDIVGLVEVDTGSIRTRSVNQAEAIGRALGHYSVYQCKYGICVAESMVCRSSQARQRVSRGAARARRAVPLLRERHQAPDHRARARGLRHFSRPLVAEVSSSATRSFTIFTISSSLRASP